MPTMAKINNLRKRRDKQFEAAVKHIRESLDNPVPSTGTPSAFVSTLQDQLQDAWQRFQSCQRQLDDLDDEDIAQETQALKDFCDLSVRLKILMDKIRLSTTTLPSHDTRGSVRDTRNVSPECNLTTATFAPSVSQQPNSTAPNALKPETTNTRDSSSTRDLKTNPREPLDQKELNPVQDNYGHTPPTENILSNPVSIPLHDTRSSTHDTRNASPTRDLTTTTYASSASQHSDSTPPDALNQAILHDRRDREKERISSGDNSAPPLVSTNSPQDVSCPITVIHKVENNVLNSVKNTEVNLKSKSTTNAPEATLVQPSSIIIEKTSYEWDSGLHVNRICRDENGEEYDTSWAELSHDSSGVELYHDTSWIVKFNGKDPGNHKDHDDRD